MALGKFSFLGFGLAFMGTVVFPFRTFSFLSPQSPVTETGSAGAGLSSGSGAPVCLLVLCGWEALLPAFFPPREGAAADASAAFVLCLTGLAAFRAGGLF